MEMRMNGRNALITGGSQGIGRAIARNFASAGANVAIVARNQGGLDAARAEIAAGTNAKVITVAADVGTADGCRKAYGRAAKSLGQIDVLVNNAGTSQRGPFEEVSDELWQHDIDLKLFAAIRLCRQALPGMKSRRWGRIINVSSISALGHAGRVNYVSAKAGVIGLTKALALELGSQGVTVNAIAPGYINTDNLLTVGADKIEGLRKTIPLGRLGEPEEIGEVAAFLAGPGGNYIVGETISVNGGVHIA